MEFLKITIGLWAILLIVVFVSMQVRAETNSSNSTMPTLQTVNENGNITQMFYPNDSVFIQGPGFRPNTNTTVGVVETTFTVATNFSIGSASTSLVTINATANNGNFTHVLIWQNLTVGDAGNYTVVCDVKGNGFYDPATDPTTTFRVNSSSPSGVSSTASTAGASPSVPEYNGIFLLVAILLMAVMTIVLKMKKPKDDLRVFASNHF